MMFQRKRAAIELSMTTIIVVVLSLTLLIMGFVFVRSIMCGAIGFTEEINSKVNREIQQLFETSGGDVVCIGSQESKTMIPGQDNFIFCLINAKQQGEDYTIRLAEPIKSADISSRETATWIKPGNDVWTEKNFPPNDKTPRKTITVSIPEEASEGNIRINIVATKSGTTGTRALEGSKNLDFRVTRSGVVRNILC